MSITEHSIEVGKLKWFYRETEIVSEKPPIIFLHGIPSQSFSWCEIMSSLAESGYRAIAPDWIGCGFSAQPDRRDFPYTQDALIKALADLITALKIEKFHLVIQGFLGSVGLQYALRYPDQIERLIILNTPLTPDAKLPFTMQQWGFPLLGDILTQDPLLVDRTLEGGSGFVISDQNLTVYRKPFLNSSDAGRALLAIVKNLKLAEAMTELASGFPNWTKPTLIIWGCSDQWLPVDQAETFASYSSSIELVKLEEAKHYPQEHWAKDISEITLNFLRSQAL